MASGSLTCYCIITPDPRQGLSISQPNGRPCFFLKFGDGTFRSSYLTENPSFASEENTKSTVPIRQTLNQNAQAQTRRIGKWLEWTYIKHPSFDGNYYGTEWYKVESSQLDAAQLGTKLQDLLVAFEGYDWNQNARRDLDVVMDELHDKCTFSQWA